MSRDNIIGLVLIAVIMIGYSIISAPSPEERQEAQRIQDSIAVVRQQELAAQQALSAQEQQAQQMQEMPVPIPQVTNMAELDTAQAAQLTGMLGQFASGAVGTQEFITLENDHLRLKISTRGGHIYSAELKNFKTWDQRPLLLFEGENNNFALQFFAENRNINTSQLFFSPYFPDARFDQQTEIIVSGADSATLAMRLHTLTHTSENPSYIEFLYKLRGDDFLIDFHINFVGTAQALAGSGNMATLDWNVKFPRLEKSLLNEQNNTTIFYKFINNEVSRLRETRDENEELATTLRWVAFKQQFFTTTLISQNGFASGSVSSAFVEETDTAHTKNMSMTVNMDLEPRADNHLPMQLYMGPTHFNTLKGYDLLLERQIPLGWGFFLTAWINRFVIIPIFNFLDGFNINYGIIILILTILIKIVTLPFSYKTHFSQAKMKLLKPEIDEIGKKFPKPDDAMKKQQATMALYKKAGVSPLAGCIPMLLQLPILLAMFRFFPASIELRQQGFLWADDLSSYDSILSLPFTIPFYGDHVSLFTLLMTVSTLIYTHLNSQMMSTGAQMPGMKAMLYIMPIMLLGMFNNFASGLSYYYFLTNVFTIGQTYIFKLFVNEDKLRAQIEENKKKPIKKSSWVERLEKMQKQQEAQRRGK
ncbi:MAG TPA: membrane protein insertase YidC [Bacteroidales bacterium]|nr:membrane protein insertase YidC [Bacteroidales bacterium]